MTLTREQSGVARGAGTAAAVCALTLAGSIYYSPLTPFHPEDPVRAWLAWNLPKALCLIASIGALGNHRFYTPADIGGAGLTQGTPQARVLQAILQNTLEQVVTAVLVQGAWVVLMPSRWQGAVGAASCLFILGRVMFWRGYAAGAGSRAFGFGCTFYPSLMMVLVMAVHLAVSAVD